MMYEINLFVENLGAQFKMTDHAKQMLRVDLERAVTSALAFDREYPVTSYKYKVRQKSSLFAKKTPTSSPEQQKDKPKKE